MSKPPSPEPVELSPPPEMKFRTECASQPALQGPSGLSGQPGLGHLGTTQLRLRTGERTIETINNYLDIFQELQIDPTFQGVFWSGVICRYRQGSRHAPLLKRGTVASIKTMTDDVLRAYGGRIWGPNSGWRSGLAAGEEMLLYDKNGGNLRLHEILTKMWWRMRELMYEEKPAPKQRGRSRKTPQRRRAVDTVSERDEKYLADIDDHTPFETDSEAGNPIPPSEIARAQVIGKLDKIADKLPTPGPEKFLSFQQTEDEIINLIGRLHDLRLASDPNIFERLWAAHIGRVEEVEAPLERYGITPMGQQVDELGNPLDPAGAEDGIPQADQDTIMEDEAATLASDSSDTSNVNIEATSTHATVVVPFPVKLLADKDIKKRVYPNYSSEPFHTSGNPIPPSLTEKHKLPPTLPKVMSIWIMCSPADARYFDRAYHHPSAPVQEQEQVAFFKQVVERAEVAEEDIKGYALSYGWCDVCRWIEKTAGQGCGLVGDGKKAGESEGERLGWEVFQKDLIDAAKAGVMVWRMKVLVVRK